MTDLSEKRLAVLVHEVRSPVAALAAISETLLEAEPRTPERVELVRLAVAACRAIERMVVYKPIEAGNLFGLGGGNGVWMIYTRGN